MKREREIIAVLKESITILENSKVSSMRKLTRGETEVFLAAVACRIIEFEHVKNSLGVLLLL